jgi:hypothetical protein
MQQINLIHQKEKESKKMSIYDDIYARIKAEATLSLSKRKQDVPCAFCVRGGNGDKSCASGWNEKRITKLTGGCFCYKGCFLGRMLDEEPEVK